MQTSGLATQRADLEKAVPGKATFASKSTLKLEWKIGRQNY